MIRDLTTLDDLWRSHRIRADKARAHRERETKLTDWIGNAETTIAELQAKVAKWRADRETAKQDAEANELQSADLADLVEEKREGTDWQPPADPPPAQNGTIFDQVTADTGIDPRSHELGVADAQALPLPGDRGGVLVANGSQENREQPSVAAALGTAEDTRPDEPGKEATRDA